MIVEDGIIWETRAPLLIEDDPLSGLPQEYVKNLEHDYLAYCSSLKSAEHQKRCHCSEEVMDATLVESAKSYGSGNWYTKSNWDMGEKLRNSAHYRKLVKKEETLASRKYREALSQFTSQVTTEVQAYLKGKKALQTVRIATAQLFKDAYQQAYLAGKRASGIEILGEQTFSKEEERWFRQAVRTELTYWNAFLDELSKTKGDFSKKAFSIDQRLAMYFETILFIYHSGRVSGFPDNVLIFWYPSKKLSGDMCKGCQYLVDKSPFTKNTLPTVPRAGDTPCLMYCKHKLVVRYATPAQVTRREANLPSKKAMLKVLSSFMRKKTHKYKASKAYNPWLGQSTWGELFNG